MHASCCFCIWLMFQYVTMCTLTVCVSMLATFECDYVNSLICELCGHCCGIMHRVLSNHITFTFLDITYLMC